jgi:pectin methylesterase-like acyl-CoA thioesterase
MRPQFRTISRCLFVLFIAITAGEKLSLAQEAQLSVSGQTYACDNFTLNTGPLNCTPNVVLLGPSTTPPLLLPTVQASRPSAVASAATEGMVQFGSISARVQASSSQLPGNPYAITTFNGFWHDAITITSSTLPSGTAVSLLVTATITYSTVCTLSPGTPVNSSGIPVGAGLGAGAT